MTRARRGALVLSVTLASMVSVALSARAQDGDADVGREAYVVQAFDASLESLLGVPELGGVAAFGGAALLVPSGVTLREAVLALAHDGAVRGATPGESIAGLTSTNVGSLALPGTVPRRARIEAVASEVRAWLDGSSADVVTVVIATATPSPANAAAGDTLGAVIVATGRPGAIAAAMDATGARPGALTSDSTRRDGVVATPDVTATIASFLGTEAPGGDLGGHVVRNSAAELPSALHERYLEQRRLYVPVGTAAALYVSVGGIAGCLALALRHRVPARVRRSLGWLALSVPALGTGLLAAGHLPELTYATVVPFLAIVTVFGTLWAGPVEQRDLGLVTVALGGVVLVAFALEAATGWRGMLTPLLGGSQLDGGRFFGMPNVAIGLVMGASVWVAQRLATRWGVALIVVAALVAGLPFAGANLGASVSLSATAGIWWAVRERRRVRAWWGLAVVAATTVVGTGVILVAHAVSPAPTHVTRFEENVGGFGGVVGTFVDRFGTGLDLLARNPAAFVPVVGLLATLVVILRPPAVVRATLERWPTFRDATLVIALGGVVAYVANDTGAAACGLAFGLALGGMVGMSLLSTAGKMARDGD